jgi:glycosyltransferase involved in cell wall biosynthesis
MKVVIVNEGLAYPPTAGNWIRTLNLMLPLAKRHEITYVCRGVADKEAVRRAREFYADHGIRAFISDDYPTAKKGAAFYGRLAANLFSSLPYSIATHNSPAVRRRILEIASTEAIDIWQFEGLAYAQTLHGRDANTLVIAHNVESLIWQRLYETESNAVKRWYIRHQWKKYERHEARVLQQATRVVAVTLEDAALLRARFGVEHPEVVDNGVDTEYFSSATDRSKANPKQILFLGSLDWRPNLDSVDLLLNRIFPSILKEEPTARLCIVGRNPPAALVRQARAHASVDLHADVPDVRPYLSRSGVMAVPLRIGGGSRLKIIEAIAAGLPVVSTRIGAEGLTFTPGRDLFVVEDADAMAPALLACMRDPAHAAEVAKSGRAVVDQRYDWSRLADRVEKIWGETRAGERAALAGVTLAERLA